MHFWNSPFIIPLAGILVAIVAIVSGSIERSHSRSIKAEERMAMIARGMSIEDIDRLLNTKAAPGEPDAQKDPLRARAGVRRAGIVLSSVGVGLILLGLALEAILNVREVLACSAAGLIPLAMGIGFFIDAHLQKREMERLGLEPPHQV
jgi:hypothetical protein